MKSHVPHFEFIYRKWAFLQLTRGKSHSESFPNNIRHYTNHEATACENQPNLFKIIIYEPLSLRFLQALTIDES
jgi:hypothetical protein